MRILAIVWCLCLTLALTGCDGEDQTASPEPNEVGDEEIPECDDFFWELLKDPSILGGWRCQNRYEEVDRILGKEATMDELRDAFTETDQVGLFLRISAMGNYWDRPELLPLLRDVWLMNREKYPDFAWEQLQDPYVRVELAGLLASLDQANKSDYDAYIRNNLDHPDDHVRSRAVSALGTVATTEDIPWLEQVIIDGDSGVAGNATHNLRGLYSRESRAALRRLIDDPRVDPDKKPLLKEALHNSEARVCQSSISSEEQAAYDTFLDRRGTLDDLHIALRSQQKEYMASVINVVAITPHWPEAFALLMDLWADERADYPELSWECIETTFVRIALALTLGRTAPADAHSYLEFLRRTLDDEDHMNRGASAFAIGVIGTDDDIPALVHLIKADNQWVAGMAVFGLESLGTENAKAALLELRDDPELTPETRKEVDQSLSRF